METHKSKTKLLIGTVVGLLVVVIVLGTTTNFMGAFKTTFKDSIVKPVIYKEHPITVSNATALGSSLVSGHDQEIYRFRVAAGSDADVNIYYLSFDINTDGLVVDDGSKNSLTNGVECSDDFRDNPPMYITEYGKSTVVGVGCYDATDEIAKFNMNVSSSGGINSGTVVSTSNSKTFSVYADVFEDSDTTTSKTISTRIHEDSSSAGIDTVNNILESATHVGMIWSNYGSTSGTHGEETAEWMNGYEVNGMPLSYVTLN